MKANQKVIAFWFRGNGEQVSCLFYGELRCRTGILPVIRADFLTKLTRSQYFSIMKGRAVPPYARAKIN